MALAQATLTTSAATIYTSSGNNVVSSMYLCNYSGVDATFTLYLVQSAGSPTDANIIYKTVNITAGDTYIVDSEKTILATGDFISGLASANTSITVTVSYWAL